ncbi:MAG: hypothetical protein RR420_00860 [Anaerovoracaceae bacterium]
MSSNPCTNCIYNKEAKELEEERSFWKQYAAIWKKYRGERDEC